eukprot:4983153-Prymnesium_polylepis.1
MRCECVANFNPSRIRANRVEKFRESVANHCKFDASVRSHITRWMRAFRSSFQGFTVLVGALWACRFFDVSRVINIIVSAMPGITVRHHREGVSL